MGLRSSLVLAVLSTSAAWAAQAPLGAANTGGNCLTLSGDSPSTVYDACCAGDTKSGSGSIDGAEFTYTCEQWALPYERTAVKATSARECAQLCAARKDCPAASWAAKGQCYFVSDASYSSRPLRSILLLEKTGKLVSEPEPVGGCGDAVDAAKVKCEQDAKEKCDAETAAIKDQCKADQTKAVQDEIRKCDEEKATLGGSCDDLKTKAEQQCQDEKDALIDAGKAQCDQEKATLTDAAKQQCDAEKASLAETAKKQCDADKDALTAAFESEKKALQKALDDANQKLKECSAGTGTGPATVVSPTTPENEALLQEISRENFSSICPKFAGKTFTTVDSQGYKHDWQLYCHSNVGGASTPNYNWSCHTQDIIKLLREQQENPNFKALWVNTNNVCTPWTGGTVFAGGPFANHHLVLPTRPAYK
ncbi:hypothetical protein BO78DRAFT_469494 [Aspergillus sclerotiicarbonarius CBS 121057]|uniref:Apple domain-containing protein n=1 Tax=Aspergillus sclerotiicarbonarius (strain CBS 121057 / IBT 28362) TaxID=1448318 RepID=A0A319EXR3_ASPSB|nr:hypothetical protein BO78DRAFT_469494 [Aspergillus sclerotiicarbonarius CBS 121057]